MGPHSKDIKDFYNPSVCCDKDCGTKCNDCYGGVVEPGVRGWSNCYRNEKQMCQKGTGGKSKCCAPDIPPDRLCTKVTPAPCRLGT